MPIITGGNSLLDASFILTKARIGENMKVADLGCGNGNFIYGAAKMVGRGGRVYAIDILKTVLENVAKRVRSENVDNIETIWSNLEILGATKINSGSLDTCLLINTLYQSRKRAEILREAKRMLKKGGFLLVVEWHRVSSPIGPPTEERVKPENLRAIAEKMGFGTEEEFEAGQFHYGVLFEKM